MLIKEIIKPYYFYTKQIISLLKGKPCATGVILMLHRVSELNNSNIIWNENMKVSPHHLEKTILMLKKKYDIIRLEDVPKRIGSKEKRKFVVFTMDDGYRDNLNVALPIFKKYNVPFTIFLTTDFMDRKAVLWWYELEQLLLKNDSVTLSNGITYPAYTKKEKADSFLKIRTEILKIEQKELLKGLESLFINYEINWASMCDSLCLSWNEVKQLKKEPLITLGAHTQHHYNLKKLPTYNDVKQEVLNGYYRLEEMANIHPAVFAYPYGSINEADKREFNVLSKLNKIFSLAVRAEGGPITKQCINKYALPRIMMEPDFSMSSLWRETDYCMI